MTTPPASARIVSLDAFRGFAIASMMLVNNPGDWEHLYAPLDHAKWNGWTFTDLVFPFFLFAAGVSLAISLERRRLAGDREGKVMLSIVKRAAVIFLVGLALNLIPSFDFSTVRIPGVLQRIAICILVAAPIAIRSRNFEVLGAIIALLVVYMGLMRFAPVPGPDGVMAKGLLEPGRDFGAWLDRTLLGGHLWAQSKTWDPEGIVSTLPAIASTLLGVLIGRRLLVAPASLATARGLIVSGVVLLVGGAVLDVTVIPINKNLWTPSYCLFMTGWSLVVFGVFHALMDGAASQRFRVTARRMLLPFTIYGMNALFLFAFSGFLVRLMIAANLKAPLYAPLESLFATAENASLAYAIAFDLAMFVVAWLMWKKGWFIKA